MAKKGSNRMANVSEDRGDQAIAEAEANALKVLRATYQQDIETLAKNLEPQLLAGEFNGLYEATEFETRLNVEKLEEICRAHPRMADRSTALIGIVLSSPEVQNLWDGNVDWESDQVFEFAAFCMALEVQRFAVRRWSAPRDDVWDDPEQDEQPATPA